MAVHTIANDAALDAMIMTTRPWDSADSSTIRLAPGIYRDRQIERNINGGKVIFESLNRETPATVRGWKFGKGTNRGNFGHLQDAGANNSLFNNITLQWITFAPELYTSARPSGGGASRPTIMPDGKGQGWRTCGTSHPSGSKAGYSENGGIGLLAFGEGCSNMTVQNCLIKGGADAVRIRGKNIKITQNDFEENHEDCMKVADFDGLEITWNRVRNFRNIPPAIGDLLGGPTRPHGDFIQFAFGSGRNATISHNQLDDETEELHFALIGNQDAWGVNENFKAQYNDSRQRHITFLRINNTKNCVVTHNKCSSSTPLVNGGGPRLEVVAAGNPARDFRNNVCTQIWGNTGSGQSGNVISNDRDLYPPDFIHCRREKVAKGARYAGQGGNEGKVVEPPITPPVEPPVEPPVDQEPPALRVGQIDLVMVGDDRFGFTVPANSPAAGCEIRWAYDTDATVENPKRAKRTTLANDVYVADSTDDSHILKVGEVKTVHAFYQGGPHDLPRSARSAVSWTLPIEERETVTEVVIAGLDVVETMIDDSGELGIMVTDAASDVTISGLDAVSAEVLGDGTVVISR